MPTASGGANQDPQWLGIYDAQVAVTTDPLGTGRVRLYVPQVLGNTQSNWAKPMQPGLIPAVGTSVQAVFLGGNPNIPYYFLGITSSTIASIFPNSVSVLNLNPFFTGGILTPWTATGGTLSAVTPNASTNPPFTYAALWTASGSGGGYITEVSSVVNVGAKQPYQVSAWVYYPVGGTVNIGLVFSSSGTQVQQFTVAANTWTFLQTVQKASASDVTGYPKIGPATSTTGEQFYATAVTMVGSIPGSLLTPNTVTPDQLAVGNLNINPFFAGGSSFGWTSGGGTFSVQNTITGGAPYPYSGQLVISSGTNFIQGSPNPFGAVQNNPYTLTAWVKTSTAQTVKAGYGFTDSTGAFLNNATQSFSIPANTWTQVQTVQSPSNSSTAYGYPYISSTSSSGTMQVSEVFVSEQTQGASVAPGTITASQIAANTITAGQIAANTITAAQLHSGIVYAGIVDSTTINSATLVGGLVEATGVGYLGYNGTPASGNLIFSATNGAGTDSFGNAYLNGVTTYGNPVGGTFIALNMAATTNSAFGLAFYSATSTGGPWTLDTWLRRSGSAANQVEFGPVVEILDFATLPSTPTAGSKLLSQNGNLIFVSEDSNVYATGQLYLFATGTQNVTSTSPTQYGQCTCPVNAGTYRISGTLIGTMGGTSAAAKCGFTGPAISAGRVNMISLETGALNYGVSSSTTMSGSSLSTGTISNGATFISEIDGWFTFSANGTLVFNVAEGTATDTWTAVDAFFDIKPT